VKFTGYLRDKLAFIIASLGCAGFCALMLYAASANLYFALFIPSIFVISCAASLVVDYLAKRRYYAELAAVLRELDEKRFLLEVIDRPTALEGQIWHDVLRAVTKSMNDAAARQTAESTAYREYIEMWVHEVKTPLAGLKLALENSRNKELLHELDKLERLVEQALFYARSGSVEADYSIRSVGLDELVNTALKNNARYLIQRKVSIEIGDLSTKVLADPKWLVFVLHQLIDNSVKYGSTRLEFAARTKGRRVLLTLRDNGIGIPPADLERVFDKGFTGANGRRFSKSTGLGLYLCQKLCRKLGVKLEITSEVGQGTTVEITFPAAP
jgi:signal transduction histidine kinase